MPKKHKQMRMNTPTEKSIRVRKAKLRAAMGQGKEPRDQGRKREGHEERTSE